MHIRLHGAVPMVLLLAGGCAGLFSSSQRERVEVTMWRQAQFEPFEAQLPIGADSIIALYGGTPPEEFRVRYHTLMGFVSSLVDSFNTTIDPALAIDTLCIDHAVESFGEAGRAGKTLYISSSYFFLYNDPAVLRSLITHEFGHIRYDLLDSTARSRFSGLWQSLQDAALFYLFREGEYSGNARFGGHPHESPAELFASAYNLVRNHPDELAARFRYVDTQHLPLLHAILETASR